MRYAFIAAQRVAFAVALLCRVMGVSRSGFYANLTEPETARERRDAALAAKTRAVFAEHEARYASPRVYHELKCRGDVVSEKKVAQVMRDNTLVARPKKRIRVTTDSKHDDPIAPNWLARDFTASAPNETWVNDVTAIWTQAGWLFLAAKGIQNAIRFFLGIDISAITPFNADTLYLGESELGVDWVLGPEGRFARYAFNVEVARILEGRERRQRRAIVEYLKPAHTHFVDLIEPLPPVVPNHWELGLSDLGETTDLH